MTASTPRDPVRIARILSKLQVLWLECPDFRLIQLCHALMPDPEVYAGSPFYLEDDILEAELDAELDARGLKDGWKS